MIAIVASWALVLRKGTGIHIQQSASFLLFTLMRSLLSLLEFFTFLLSFDWRYWGPLFYWTKLDWKSLQQSQMDPYRTWDYLIGLRQKKEMERNKLGIWGTQSQIAIIHSMMGLLISLNPNIEQKQNPPLLKTKVQNYYEYNLCNLLILYWISLLLMIYVITNSDFVMRDIDIIRWNSPSIFLFHLSCL